jgi:hypothetical protein
LAEMALRRPTVRSRSAPPEFSGFHSRQSLPLEALCHWNRQAVSASVSGLGTGPLRFASLGVMPAHQTLAAALYFLPGFEAESSRVQRQPEKHHEVPHQVSQQARYETAADSTQRSPGHPAEQCHRDEEG